MTLHWVDDSGIADTAVAVPADVARVPGYLTGEWTWNGAAFIQQNVWTEADGTRYAVWWDKDRIPMVGKLAVGAEAWTTASLAGTAIGTTVQEDAHMTLAVVVDADGYIHVAGNFHLEAWRSIRSTTPGDISAWTSQGSSISAHSSASYPTWVRTLDGDLLAVWRSGTNAVGSMYLNRWDGTAWGTPLEVIDGSPTSENGYWHRIAVDVSGRIHVFIVWRGSGGPTSATDLSYLRSDDDGITWVQSDGTAYTLPVTHTTAEQAVAIPSGSNLLNSGGADADASANPHAAILRNDASGYTQIVHVWHDGTTWHDEDVTTFTDTIAFTADGYFQSEVSRPALLCPDNGGTVIVHRTDWLDANVWLWAIDVSVPDSPRPYRLARYDLDQYEPTIDTGAARFHDRLTLLAVALQFRDGGADYVRKLGQVWTWPASMLTTERPIGERPGAPDPTGPYYDAVTADSPVGYWRLSEDEGATAVDEQAVADGTYVGSPTLGVTGATADGDTAVTLNGTSQYVTLPAEAAWNVATITVEAWVKTTSTAVMMIVSRDKNTTGSAVRVFQFRLNAGKVEGIVWNNAGTIFANFASTGTVHDGAWHHVALTVDGTASKLYIDGVEDGSASGGSVKDDGTVGMYLGRAVDSSSAMGYFDGSLDHVAYYGAALTASQISAHVAAA